MSIWASFAEREAEFRRWTLSPAQARKRGLLRRRPGRLDPAAMDAAHGLARPERILATPQPFACPECDRFHGHRPGCAREVANATT